VKTPDEPPTPFRQDSTGAANSPRKHRERLSPDRASAELASPGEKRTGGRPPRIPENIDSTQWLTRGRVARLLGVHVSTVRRLETRRELVPVVVNGSGLRYFTLNQVINLKRRQTRMAHDRAADIRLDAFDLFRRGVDWRDVAIRLRYDPLRVHRLWHLYSAKEKGDGVKQ
jgi:MerR HTH family regulatory protein